MRCDKKSKALENTYVDIANGYSQCKTIVKFISLIKTHHDYIINPQICFCFLQ